jgi:hypothetical protein
MARAPVGAPGSAVRAPSSFAALVAAALASAAPVVARAGEGDGGGADAWHVEAGAGTDFPLDVGVRAGVEAPGRLRLSTSLGVLPGPYVSAVDGVLRGAGAYGGEVSDVVRDTLPGSLVWRTHVGWRPLPKAGFYADVGYGLVSVGGDVSGERIAKLIRQSATVGALGPDFTVGSTLHMLDVELGWRFAVAPHVAVATALGGAFTVASSSSVTPKAGVPAGAPAGAGAVLAQAGDEAERRLDHVYTSYVFTPVLSLHGAYVFF